MSFATPSPFAPKSRMLNCTGAAAPADSESAEPRAAAANASIALFFMPRIIPVAPVASAEVQDQALAADAVADDDNAIAALAAWLGIGRVATRCAATAAKTIRPGFTRNQNHGIVQIGSGSPSASTAVAASRKNEVRPGACPLGF